LPAQPGPRCRAPPPARPPAHPPACPPSPLPRPQVTPATLDIWLARAPPHKVAALALSSKPGSGSLTLRRVAQQHGAMVAFGRVHAKVRCAALGWGGRA
jgi:hypothetical protein